MYMTNISRLGSWSWRVIFPLTCRWTCGLGDRPILTSQADTHQLFVDHDMLLRNTTAVVIITLGRMTFGAWHERDSGKARGRKFRQLSQTRELKLGVPDPPVCIIWRYPKTRDFRNDNKVVFELHRGRNVPTAARPSAFLRCWAMCNQHYIGSGCTFKAPSLRSRILKCRLNAKQEWSSRMVYLVKMYPGVGYILVLVVKPETWVSYLLRYYSTRKVMVRS